MASTIIMPKQGLLMTHGTIMRWNKQEGEPVEKGETLFEMETDKLTIEIASTATGTLLKTLAAEGETVPIATPIAIVGEVGEDISKYIQSTSDLTEEANQSQQAQVEAPPPPAFNNEERPRDGRVFITPRAKTLAEKKGFDFTTIQGSGPDGLIIEKDVQAIRTTPLAANAAAEKGVMLSAVQGSGDGGRVMLGDVASRPDAAKASATTILPLTGARKYIAQNMHQSLQTMAQANHRITVNMTEAVRWRESLKPIQKVSYNDIVLKVTAQALKDVPELNASMTEDSMLLHNSVNLGMAVDVDGNLLVPVINNAEQKSLLEISSEAKTLAQSARDKKLSPDSLTGGTFTVSNLGMFELDSFTAIINPPECGILAVGRVYKAAVVGNDGAIIAQDIMQLSLTYDHRVVDGAMAARFLQRIKHLLENPYLLI
ncbi:2-oxo acid dehydrogenase subunit E2 [Clostridia bacterium OttesenSCG-928-F22]|nr:2-oxo acid dehydrogenase subunit E2 [Clostridia bacterium OttesenSCG-928-F22]